MRSFKREFVKWKLRLQFAGSLASMFGVPYLVATQLDTHLGVLGFNVPFYVIMLVGIFTLLVLGYLYDRLGFMEAENGYAFSRNTEWQKMQKVK